jgi:hypothetical protein
MDLLSKQQEDIFTAPRSNEELYSNDNNPDQFENIAGLQE